MSTLSLTESKPYYRTFWQWWNTFHNMVGVIIKGVLKQGMFGELVHYYGTIEYQGRFTPHIHMAVSLLF